MSGYWETGEYWDENTVLWKDGRQEVDLKDRGMNTEMKILS